MKIIIDDACYAYDRIFGALGEVVALAGREITAAVVRGADVLIVRSRTRVDEGLLAGSSVRFVGSTVAGLEHIDEAYLRREGIGFFSAQGCNSMAVAEFVISGIVNLAGELGFDYRQKSLGIVGVGNVGSRLAGKADLMGIRTLLNDPIRERREEGGNFVDLETALGADIVSFHTPLTKQGECPSYHLLNAGNFDCIGEQTIVFNAARGGVIDERVWERRVTKANVIDCWENEPRINQRLQRGAYLATPHIAGHSVDAKFRGSFMVYEALCEFLGVAVDRGVANLIDPGELVLGEDNLQGSLNAVYDFKRDAGAIADVGRFEYYRRHYPIRYEWHHYRSGVKLPIV